MGLDQYVYIVKKSENNKVVDMECPENMYLNNYYYWRKHANLEGFMRELYYSKGGESESFNNNSVKLEEKDVKRLGVKTLEGVMPVTTGFFFGESLEEHDIMTLEFIAKALRTLKEGEYDMYYMSSW